MHNDQLPAQAINPGFSKNTISGSLTFSDQHAVFVSAVASLQMPLETIQITRGGNNSEYAFLKDPAQPDWTLYTRASHLSALNHPALLPRLRALPKPPTHAPLLVIATTIAVLIALLVFLFFSQKDRAVRYLADQIPPSWEVELGNTLFAQFRPQILQDAPLKNQLDRVTERLVSHVPDLGYPIQFHLIEDPSLNAFAIPGGHIVVHSGLLKAVRRPEELAGVLSHEIAHLVHRHGFRKLIDSAGLFLLIQGLLGDSSGLLALLADSSEFLLKQKYSRDFELEADDSGFELLVAAQIHPQGLIDFFRTLQTEASTQPQLPTLLSTHPLTRERIERLEIKLATLPSTFKSVDM